MKKAILLSLILVMTGCGGSGFESRDLQKIFKVYVADPIPATVELLEGEKINWQDAPVQLIFHISEEDFKQISVGYEVVSFKEIAYRATHAFGKEFTQIPGLISYRKTVKTEYAERVFYLFWDAENNKAYFMKYI